MTLDTFSLVSILSVALLGAAAISLLVIALGPKVSWVRKVPQDLLAEPRSFVFRDGYLVEHSGGAGFLLPLPVNHLTAWDNLVASLSDLVAGAGGAMVDLLEKGNSFHLSDTLGQDRLTLVGLRDGDTLRITLSATDQRQDTMRIDRRTLEGLHQEIGNLRRASETSPSLSWCLDPEGRIVWANGAYRDKLVALKGLEAGHIWPIPAIFPDECSLTPGTMRRNLQVLDRKTGDRANNWFELWVSEASNGERFVHAMPMDKVVKAEETLRTYIQTLTKTFAHLPTGLAIFDRERQLALFNPTLIDLTGLDGSWLSKKPTLESFFDHLREMQRIPEPKDYKAWRDGLTQVERASETGAYEETWTLSTGQTYRVTGRPHTDGAVALLIEDISAELAVTRRFRTEVELFQSVIDATDDALVVVSNAGHISLSNAAYANLWNDDPRFTVAMSTATDAIKLWQEGTEPTPLWGEIREFLTQTEDRAEWYGDAKLRDARKLDVKITPLPGGATMIGFSHTLQGGQALPRQQDSDQIVSQLRPRRNQTG